ncbi:MAG: hypothetical protein ACXQTP_05590 [Candidatus Methanofastidiosia archaeon]
MIKRNNEFFSLLKWELNKIGRFPIPELFLVTVGFQIGLHMFDISSSTSSGAFGHFVSHTIVGSYKFFIWVVEGRTLSELFITLTLFSAVLVTISLASEIENGILKTYISRPIGRQNVFVAKFVSVFSILSVFSSVFLVCSIYALDPSTYLQLLGAWRALVLLVILLFITTFFITSLGFFIATISKSVAVTPLGTLGCLLVLNVLSSRVVYFPGESLSRIVVYALEGIGMTTTQAATAIAFMPILGIVFFAFSYYQFVRRLDLN